MEKKAFPFRGMKCFSIILKAIDVEKMNDESKRWRSGDIPITTPVIIPCQWKLIMFSRAFSSFNKCFFFCFAISQNDRKERKEKKFRRSIVKMFYKAKRSRKIAFEWMMMEIFFYFIFFFFRVENLIFTPFFVLRSNLRLDFTQ